MFNAVDFFYEQRVGEQYPHAKPTTVGKIRGIMLGAVFYLPVHIDPMCYVSISPITVDNATAHTSKLAKYCYMDYYDCSVCYTLPAIEQHKQLYTEYPIEVLGYYSLEWLFRGAVMLGSKLVYLDSLNPVIHGQCKGVCRICLRL